MKPELGDSVCRRRLARLAAFALALALAMGATAACAESGAKWTFGVPLTLCQSAYAQLVNRDHLLEETYKPEDLVRISVRRTSSAAILMRNIAADAMRQMFEAAEAQDVLLYVDNAYRAYSTQKTMYQNRLESNGGKDDGVVAYPGSSDHQTGLGADVVSKSWIGKRFTESFGDTPEAKWMADYCCDYGFIIRYPKNATMTTGIIYEPWHLRYVGREVAGYMYKNELTLEEFYDQWQAALSEYLAAGGSVEQALQVEWEEANRIPTPTETEVFGEDGDVEISIAF